MSKMVTVLKETPRLGENASPVTRMRITEEEFEANPGRFKLDEREERPCFDGLTKAEQKKVLANQAERQKRYDEANAK